MKKYFVVILLFAMIGLQAQNRSKIESAANFTWYGIDFTKAQMVGTDVDFSDPAKIVSQFMPGWNQLFLDEPKKYDLEGTFKKRMVNDLSKVTEQNASIDYLKLVTDKANTVTAEDVAAVVKNYGGGEGIGLLFVVENFDKAAGQVRFWVAVFDAKSQEILLAKKAEGKVGSGFGFRNFWASGFYSAFKEMKSLYPKWLKSLS